MMKFNEIKNATRLALADELAADCEDTEGWETMCIEELKRRVFEVLVRQYEMRKRDDKPITNKGLARAIKEHWGLPNRGVIFFDCVDKVTWTDPDNESASAWISGTLHGEIFDCADSGDLVKTADFSTEVGCYDDCDNDHQVWNLGIEGERIFDALKGIKGSWVSGFDVPESDYEWLGGIVAAALRHAYVTAPDDAE